MKPDSLHTKLKALVEEWKRWPQRDLYTCNKCGYCGEVSEHEGCNYLAGYAPSLLDRLAALLAESEPEPCSAAACTSTEHHSTDCPARRPDCEAKAKLLGHEFVAAVDSLGRASKSSADFCGECGQPRSAHEVK